VNAAQQANSIEMTSKIAAIVNLFRSYFPDVSADLKPWIENEETKEFDDPNALDFAFHFPGRNFRCHSNSILMQIRLCDREGIGRSNILGIELSGHDYRGQQWRFSTIGKWEFWGVGLPLPAEQEKFKQMCRQIMHIFDRLPKTKQNK
jgi:hypothetical protein